MRPTSILYGLICNLVFVQLMNAQPYKGGSSDGVSWIGAGSMTLSVPGTLYKGGSNDGYAFVNAGTLNLIVPGTLFKGGLNDGSAIVSAGSMNLYLDGTTYKGGAGDGVTFTGPGVLNLSVPGTLYKGGLQDGDNGFAIPNINLSICGDTVVWTGNYDINWDNPMNWDCGKVPGPTNSVMILLGKPRYPSVRFNTEIRRLIIRVGASVTVNAGRSLLINGN